MSEAILSPRKLSCSWLQADMKRRKTIPCVFPWSHFTSPYNLFRGKRRKLLLLLFLFPLFPIRSTVDRKQTATKRQQGPTQKNKSADLISLLCLSFTKWVQYLPPRQKRAQPASHWSSVTKRRDNVTPLEGMQVRVLFNYQLIRTCLKTLKLSKTASVSYYPNDQLNLVIRLGVETRWESQLDPQKAVRPHLVLANLLQ